MEHIYKKIVLEDLRTRTPGMMPYIPFDNGITTGYTVPTTASTNGNWGGFPANINVSGETVIYATLIKRYNEIKKILAQGLKLKKVNSNGFYSARFNDVKEKYDFTPYDVNDFTFNTKRLYYKKNSPSATEGFIILIPNYDGFVAMGGYNTVKLAERYIGILDIPATIEGEKVPAFLYKSQINGWIDWLEKHQGSSDCCVLREYNKRGGDAMLNFLRENNTPYELPDDSELSCPTFDVSLLLNQEYKDVGILTPYDESMDYSAECASGLTPQLITGVTFDTESKLSTLRTRQKKFANDGSVLDYIGNGEIPYKTGEIFNPYVKDATAGTYVADSIIGITYYKTVDGEEVTAATIDDAKFVEFDYVLTGDFGGTPIEPDTDNCTELTISNIPEVLYVSNSGYTGQFNVYVNPECTGWTAWVGEEEKVYLNIVKENGEITTAITYNVEVSAKGGYVNLGVNSNTKWSITSNAEWLTVSPIVGVNDANLRIKLETNIRDSEFDPEDPFRYGALTIVYGDSYEYTKTIVFKQATGYLFTDPIEACITGYSISAEESKSATTRTFDLFSSGNWYITNPMDWCEVSRTSGPPASDQESNPITITIQPNNESYSRNRQGYLIIENDVTTITIPINQAAASYYVMVLGVKDEETGEIDTSPIVLASEDESSATTLTLVIYDYNNGNLREIEPGSAEYRNVVGGWEFVSFQDEDGNDIPIGLSGGYATLEPTASTTQGTLTLTNILHNESEVSGYLTLCLGNEPDVTIISPLITLSNYVLYVASGYTYDNPPADPQLWFATNDLEFLVPPVTGVLDMTVYVEKDGEWVPSPEPGYADLDVFTTVPTGWTSEIVYEPYFNIEFTGDTFSRDNSVTKFDISSNMVWEASYKYLTSFDDDAEEVGEYVYVTSSEDAYENAPSADKGEGAALPTADEDSPLYYKVGDTYWKKIEYPDWCSVIPGSGTGDAKCVLYLDENPYDERYCEITLKASGTTLSGVDVVFTHVIRITQEGADALLMLKPTAMVQDGPISSVTVLSLNTTGVTFTPSEGFVDVTVLCDGDWTAAISGNTENASNYWCRVAPTHGNGTQNITVLVNNNTAVTEGNATGRTDYLVVTDLTKEMVETLEINQENETFILQPLNGEIASATITNYGYLVEMDYLPDLFNFRVTANTQWQVDYPDTTPVELNWYSVIPDTTEGSQDFTIFVRDNVKRGDSTHRTVSERTVDLTAHTVSNAISKVIRVHQTTGETVAPSPSVIGAPQVEFVGAALQRMTAGSNEESIKLVFEWDPVSGATSYDLYFGKGSNYSNNKIYDSYTSNTNPITFEVWDGNSQLGEQIDMNQNYTFGAVAKSSAGTDVGLFEFIVSPSEITIGSASTITATGVRTNLIQNRGQWTANTEYGNFAMEPASMTWTSGQSGTGAASAVTVTADTGTSIQYSLTDTTNFAYSSVTSTITSPNGQIVGRVYPRSTNTTTSARTATLNVSATTTSGEVMTGNVQLTQSGGSTPPTPPTGGLFVKMIKGAGVPYDSLVFDTTGVTEGNSVTLVITGNTTAETTDLLSVTSYSDAVNYYENNQLVCSTTITTRNRGSNVTTVNSLHVKDSWVNRISINNTIGLAGIYADANDTEVNKKWVIESITPSGKSAITNPLTITQNGIRAFAWKNKEITDEEGLDYEGVSNINLCISGVNNAYVSQIVLGNATASNITTATTSSISDNGMTIDIGYNNSDTSKIKIGAITINENTSDESRQYDINITIAIGNTTVRTATVTLVQDGTPEEGGE